MPSKQGKRAKRDAPVDSALEKSSKNRAHSPKKTPSKKTKAGKKKGSVVPVPELNKESATTLLRTEVESAVAPAKAKGVVIGSHKRKSTAVPFSEDKEKQVASSAKVGKKSVALRPSKGQKKSAVSSSSPKGG
jgi:hypothetical protein